MSKYVKISSAWKSIDNAYVKVSTAWKSVDTIYVKVGSAWKIVWNNVVYTLTGDNINVTDGASPYNTRSGIRVNADGTLDKAFSVNGDLLAYTQIDSATDWVIPNGAASADHDVRITAVTHNGHAGWNASASEEDAWIDLGSDRLWDIQSSAEETINTDFTLEIRDASAATVASTAFNVQITNIT